MTAQILANEHYKRCPVGLKEGIGDRVQMLSLTRNIFSVTKPSLALLFLILRRAYVTKISSCEYTLRIKYAVNYYLHMKQLGLAQPL